jgi:hypothetical protein
MKGHLTAAQVELLEMIQEVEALVTDLQSVEARVPSTWMADLSRIRKRVENSTSKSVVDRRVVVEILTAAAAEAIKWLLGTFNCASTARNARRSLYADWRINKIPTFSRWCAPT